MVAAGQKIRGILGCRQQNQEREEQGSQKLDNAKQLQLALPALHAAPDSENA